MGTIYILHIRKKQRLSDGQPFIVSDLLLGKMSQQANFEPEDSTFLEP